MDTYVHGDRNNHQLCVEAHERLVLGETDLVDKPDLHNAQKVPVEASVDDEDEDLRDLVPDIVDLNESWMRWLDVRWNPDTEDGDIDGRDDDDGPPLDVPDSVAMFSDERNTVDDDLHEQLDLEHPEEENEEQDRYTIRMLALNSDCL